MEEEGKRKRFYWLKFKEDFFQDEAIDWLEEQENGSMYVLFYLKICLKSLKTNGILIRSVGDVFVPYSADKLAEITRCPVDTVVVALELLKKIGLVKIIEQGAMYLPQVETLTGSEVVPTNDHAIRQKRYREKKKLEANRGKAVEQLVAIEQANNVTDNVTMGVTNNVTTSVTSNVTKNVTRDKSIEYRDKEKKIIKRKESIRHKYGSYNNVLLSDEELAKFQSEFTDWERFIEELSGWLAENGKTKKDYLAALRNWGKRDYNGNNQLRRLSKGASSQVVNIEPLEELII